MVQMHVDLMQWANRLGGGYQPIADETDET